MRLRLVLADESSPLCGQEFSADLPPPQTGYGDFIILRSRWDAAMQQHWRVGDECQVHCFPLIALVHAEDDMHGNDVFVGVQGALPPEADEGPCVGRHLLCIFLAKSMCKGDMMANRIGRHILSLPFSEKVLLASCHAPDLLDAASMANPAAAAI